MKAKQRLFLVAMVLITLLTGCGQPASSPKPLAEVEPELAQELQNTLDSAFEASGAVGVSVAVIMPGERIWTGVSGNSHPGQPITEEMLFDMGSAGKMLAAPLMLDLAEEGLLSLEDPIDQVHRSSSGRRWIDPHPVAAEPYQRAGKYGRASRLPFPQSLQ